MKKGGIDLVKKNNSNTKLLRPKTTHYKNNSKKQAVILSNWGIVGENSKTTLAYTATLSGVLF